MNDANSEYYAALRRLQDRKAKINNDTVAIEAGRKKGSIKKSRPQFSDLIRDIHLAASNQRRTKDGVAPENPASSNESKEKIRALKSEIRELERSLGESMAREVSLVAEIYQLRKELVTLRGGKVIPIRPDTDTKRKGEKNQRERE